jgi:light-harvesting complex I chlorophyll a/b binding protein 1
MRTFVLALCLGAASAFVAPVGPAARPSAVRTNAVEDMIGADVETAGVWDPFNYAKDGEAALYRRRCTEIKHGRVAQLAVLGFVVGKGGAPTFPGYLDLHGLKFADVPAGLGALKAVPPLGWAQIFLLAGILETRVLKQDPNKEAGDVASFDWWVRYDDPEVKKAKLTSEIKNGRLAMMAIMGMMVQEMVTGQTLTEQLAAGNINPFPKLV